MLRFPLTNWRILVSLLILPLFLAVPAWLLVDNYIYSVSPQKISGSWATLNPPGNSYFGNPAEIYSSEKAGYPSDLCVTFEFFGLNQATSYTNFGILIGVTEQGKKDISKLVPHRKTGWLIFKSNNGLASFTVPFSLLALEQAPVSHCGNGSIKPAELDQHAGIRRIQSIFTLGEPQAFPDDWYELDDTVTVRAGQELPSSLIMTSRDEGWLLTTSVYDPSNKNSAAPNQLMFKMRRQAFIIFYTYWVAAMPFVLLIGVLGIRYFPRKMVPERKIPEAYEVAFGVAATMVAVLPLRIVLVPNSLPGLTRLDIWFGVGITFLVASSILWVIATSWVSADGNQVGSRSNEAADAHRPG